LSAAAVGLQRIVYLHGEPFLRLTEGRWTVEVRSHARAPWRHGLVLTVAPGAERALAYHCDGENPLIRVRAA
jgi:hypothetical protein